MLQIGLVVQNSQSTLYKSPSPLCVSYVNYTSCTSEDRNTLAEVIKLKVSAEIAQASAKHGAVTW